MNNKHLSEQEMQAMALDPGNDEPGAALHLSTCIHCQTAVENYRMLFAALETQEKPAPGFDLSQLVLSQLPHSKPGFFYKYSPALLIAMGAVLMAGSAYSIGKDYLLSLQSGYAAIFISLVLIIFAGIFIFQMLHTTRNYNKNIRALNNY